MKNINKILAIALLGSAAVGCNDLSTEPLSSYVTTDQKEAVVESNPEMASAAVNALPQALKNVMANYSSIHTDFGVPSMFIITDSRGQDLVADNTGYNWYSAAASMADFGGTYYDNLLFWNTFYKEVLASNLVIGSISEDTENGELQYFLGQGLVFRAYSLYNLTQMYQFTYAKNPEAPCIPIVTDENRDEVAINGNPRATVAEMYAQILSDLDRAETALTKAADQGYTRGDDKRFVDLAVVAGLKARAYLVMQNWAEAATEAQKAIDLATAEGLSPYTTSEASVPAFCDITDHNFIWGIQNLSTESFTQGVVNFASMMGSWMSNGYCSAGVYRRINKKLYASIPTTDVRKGWWLNENTSAPSTLPAAYRSYISSCTGSSAFVPYTQIKFGAADNNPGSTSGATDVPLMRVEEMYLILAEAQGMQGTSKGIATLESFIKTYRNTNYSYTAGTSTSAFQDEVWFHRRLELWGEGFAYYDLMRLQKGIDRVGGGFDAAWVFQVAPDDPVLLYEIIQSEAQANSAIGDVSNGASVPTPIAE